MKRGYITGAEARDIARVTGLLLTTAKHKPWEPPDVHPDSNHPDAYLDCTRMAPIDRLRVALVKAASQYLDECLWEERWQRYLAAGRPIDNVPPVTLEELAAIYKERYANRMVERRADPRQADARVVEEGDHGGSLDPRHIFDALQHPSGELGVRRGRAVSLRAGAHSRQGAHERAHSAAATAAGGPVEARPLGTLADRARGLEGLILLGRPDAEHDRAHDEVEDQRGHDEVGHAPKSTAAGEHEQARRDSAQNA